MSNALNPTYGDTLTDDEAIENLHVGRRLARLVSGAPEKLRSKMKKVTIIMVLSYAVSAGACVALVFGVVSGRSAELFTVFVMLGSGAVGIAASIGLAMLCWSALMRQQLLDLEQRAAVAEMAHEVLTVAEELATQETQQELVKSCMAASDRASEAACQVAVGAATGLVRDRLEHLIDESREERQRKVSVG